MAMDLEARRSTVNATARRLGVHAATVWRWILTGVRGRRLASILIGGRRFILEPDLQAFLDAGNTPRHDSDAEFERRAEAAARQLEAMGIAAATFAHRPERTPQASAASFERGTR